MAKTDIKALTREVERIERLMNDANEVLHQPKVAVSEDFVSVMMAGLKVGLLISLGPIPRLMLQHMFTQREEEAKRIARENLNQYYRELSVKQGLLIDKMHAALQELATLKDADDKKRAALEKEVATCKTIIDRLAKKQQTALQL